MRDDDQTTGRLEPSGIPSRSDCSEAADTATATRHSAFGGRGPPATRTAALPIPAEQRVTRTRTCPLCDPGAGAPDNVHRRKGERES